MRTLLACLFLSLVFLPVRAGFAAEPPLVVVPKEAAPGVPFFVYGGDAVRDAGKKAGDHKPIWTAFIDGRQMVPTEFEAKETWLRIPAPIFGVYTFVLAIGDSRWAKIVEIRPPAIPLSANARSSNSAPSADLVAWSARSPSVRAMKFNKLWDVLGVQKDEAGSNQSNDVIDTASQIEIRRRLAAEFEKVATSAVTQNWQVPKIVTEAQKAFNIAISNRGIDVDSKWKILERHIKDVGIEFDGDSINQNPTAVVISLLSLATVLSDESNKIAESAKSPPKSTTSVSLVYDFVPPSRGGHRFWRR
jgi:hypothetical protein